MELAFALVAASAAPAPQATAAAMFMAGISCFGLMRRTCQRARRGNPLRRCPLCLSEAVGAAEYELMDGLQIRVRQRCGQCGVWRRIVTGPAVVALHKRNLEADQMRIQRRLERLARGRTPVDADAFHNR